MSDPLQLIRKQISVAADLTNLTRTISSVMSANACCLYLVNAKAHYYQLKACYHGNTHRKALSKIALEKGIAGQIALRLTTIHLPDLNRHPYYQQLATTFEKQFHTYLGVPVTSQGQVIGVLTIQRKSAHGFNHREQALLATIALQLAPVMLNRQAGGKQQQSLKIKGTSGAPGIAMGYAKTIHPANNLAELTCQHKQNHGVQNIATELQEFNQALEQVRQEICRLKQQLANHLAKQEGLLFDAYLSILDDPQLTHQVVTLIKQGYRAQDALKQVIIQHINQLKATDDSHLQDQAVDIKALGLRILSYLQRSPKQKLTEQTILVGEEISVPALAEPGWQHIAAIVSSKGSYYCHLAIITRALGIPTVLGIPAAELTALNGQQIIVDGQQGQVIFNPGPKERHHYQQLVNNKQQLNNQLAGLTQLPTVTLDHHKCYLWLNTGTLADAAEENSLAAAGVGLYRSELSFIRLNRLPSEEEQLQTYQQQLGFFAPRPVTMRTLDMGGDKKPDYFAVKELEEDNPFLGWRGLRITLDHPDIFISQIRAMLKASQGLDNLRILLPMVTSINEVVKAKALITQAHKQLLAEGYPLKLPPLGAMLEVPVMIYQIPGLAQHIDFLCIGTNDLCQYLLAVDRNNPRVANSYSDYHPGILKALQQIAQISQQQNITLTICGELASDPCWALLLIAMGFNNLSMDHSRLLTIKKLIRSVKLTQAQQILNQAESLQDGNAIEGRLKQALNDLGLSDLLGPQFEV